jgi:hypothetical protein
LLDQTISDNVEAAVGINPETSWASGIFFIEHDEIATCFLEYAIAHERSSDGYFQSWFDNEAAIEVGSYTFTVEIEDVNGDLYFMVDTYPMETIPRFAGCIDPATTEASSPGELDGPQNVEISVSVSSNSNIENLKQYHDSYPVPILINNYFAGDTITIVV